MENDTLTNVVDNTLQWSDEINIWFIISIIEFILIIVLYFRKKSKSINRKLEIKNEVKKEGKIDFYNTVNSAFNSDELYNELIRKYHPDRFVNDDSKVNIANKIFQEITKNKLNIQKLEELKKEAEQKLGK